MKLIALLFALLLVGAPALAQRELYDRFSYVAPAGYTKNQDNKRLVFEKNSGASFAKSCSGAWWAARAATAPILTATGRRSWSAT
jgi:hypothetical protein